MSKDKDTNTAPIILQSDEYCWVSENDTGNISLIEGPTRIVLLPNQTVCLSKKKKVTVKDNEWVIVKNYYDPTLKQCTMGKREVRQGPVVFSLYPGEEVESGGVQKAYVLNSNQAIIVQATDSFTCTSTDGKEEIHQAGEKWVVKGPVNFIPNKNEKVIRQMDSINVSQNQAIYVRNITTSELKLVKGPASYILGHDEELFNKSLGKKEYSALGIKPVASYNAVVIQLQKSEIVCIIDFKTHTEKYIVGPRVHILAPYETVKVVNLSGGVPKKEGVVLASRVRFGPDFMNDAFDVRTKDNALLKLQVTYKWRFVVHEDKFDTIFSGDFIGYACQSMRSRIREAAAGTNFEQFHCSSANILRERLFKEYTVPVKYPGESETQLKVQGRYFRENSFLVFELDVKEVTPVDEEIASLLNESIKSNMKILCRKLEDSAQLQNEKERIESEAEIARLRRNLIEIENANHTKSTIEKARIEGAALIEKSRAEKEAQELLEKSRIETELQRMRHMLDMLASTKGARYLDFIRVQSINKNVEQALIVPSDTKTLFLSHPSMQPSHPALALSDAASDAASDGM